MYQGGDVFGVGIGIEDVGVGTVGIVVVDVGVMSGNNRRDSHFVGRRTPIGVIMPCGVGPSLRSDRTVLEIYDSHYRAHYRIYCSTYWCTIHVRTARGCNST